MKAAFIVSSAALLMALAGRADAQAVTPTPVDCEAIRCQVQAAINTNCSCDDSSNHGRYVSCVNRVIRESGAPAKCRGKITRCAAISTCGKPGFETCVRTRAGTCDTSTGACTLGTLAAGLTVCAANTDCVAGTNCSIMRAFSPRETPAPGADRCTVLGGTPGTGSCCTACP